MTGRTALVTGGGQQSDTEPGVGYAICRTLAGHGARVAVLDRDEAAARRTVERIEKDGVQAGAIWGAFAAARMAPEMREVRKGWSALGTEGSPWDIAQATLFLASDHARWVSGQILSVDGGPGVGRPPRPPAPPTVEVTT